MQSISPTNASLVFEFFSLTISTAESWSNFVPVDDVN